MYVGIDAIRAIFATLLIITGTLFLCGKGKNFLRGQGFKAYFITSKDLIEYYNEDEIRRFSGFHMIIIAFAVILFSVADYLKRVEFTICAIALLFVITLGSVIYIHTAKRFRKK